jgi:hypothetical protein
VVLLHLESISTELFSRFSEDFPALRALRARSTTFSNFFTTCPSSVTTFADVMYGNTSELEHIEEFDAEGNRPSGYEAHLMDVLREGGYRCHGLGGPPIWRDDINGWGIFGSGAPFEWLDDSDGFHARLREIIASPDPAPFAIYVWDLLSHLSYSGHAKPEELDGFSRIRTGYQALDATVAVVQEALAARGMDDTIIVAFGDHGDELWTHGTHFGFCHAFEPYTDITRTPASVYVPGAQPAELPHITSTADIKRTILDLTGIRVDEPSRWDSGCNMFDGGRKTAPCRTLFANQRPNKALPKCYSVSNAEYSLIAGPKGLEMYNFRMDPTNHNNLLTFFDLGADGSLTFNNRGVTHSHFRRTFNAALVAVIQRQFQSLVAVLAEDIRNRMTDLGDRYVNTWDPAALARVRPREHAWNESYTVNAGGEPGKASRVRAFIRGPTG